MKKILAILLALLMLPVALLSCRTSDTAEPPEADGDTPSDGDDPNKTPTDAPSDAPSGATVDLL